MTTYSFYSQNILIKPRSLHKKPGSYAQPSLNNLSLFHHFSSSRSSLSNPSSSVHMALFITRPKHRFITNPSIIHLFSTSSENDNASQSPPSQEEEEQQQQQEKQTSFSSYFSDVKASLKQQQQQRNPQSQHQPNLPPLRRPNDINPSMSKPTSKINSLEEIRRNLADFRIRSSAHFPTPSSSSNTIPLSNQQQPKQPISFHELFKRNKAAESENDNSGAGGNEPNKTGTLSFAAIRETMRQIRPNANTDRNSNANASRSGAASLLGFSNSLKLGKDGVIGGTDGLSKLEQGNVPGGLGMEFVRVYSYEELGQMLRSLRPEVKEGEKVCFSVEELSERLRKLRAMEEREAESRTGTMPFKEIRESLFKLKDDGEKARKAPIQIHRLNLLSTTPEFMMHPPKEHLVEKYFHPDNMSSAEKMKIELSKVREEFKMSESDCGSARVQVAQLTTKIKHLSSVLHKKDKHSRKGLQEMVQKRKKLLKYLRRTDWDSYCFVLSKLGLRDNPDFKYLARN